MRISDVHFSEHGSALVARVTGEIDLSNADDIGAVIALQMPNQARMLVLDLTAIEYLDSAGMRLIFRLQEKLRALDPVPDTALHGDLVPDNILVDQELRPLAVLDFGFLTTAGDPRLDAAVAAAITNMYGAHAPRITGALTAQLAADLGYPASTLLVYQGAYAVATANAFTADGSDGHFAWCVRQLARADVTAVLLA